MNDPLVSVIVTVRNGERYLPAALASIQGQGYRPLEIIVIDGQSVDATAEIATAAEGVRYIRQTDEGIANARNEGIDQARGDLIAFLDADDEWVSGKLRKQVDYLKEHPRIIGTIAWLRFLVESPYLNGLRGVSRFYRTDMVGYTPGTLVARRDLFRRVGRFEPAYTVACDADWFARMMDSGQPVEVLSEVLLVKRIHGSNASLHRGRVRQETMAVLRNSLIRKRRSDGSTARGADRPAGSADLGTHAASPEDANSE